MALLVFLPSGARPTVVLELLPPPPTTETGLEVKPPYWHLYRSLSAVLGIPHVQKRVRLAPPCSAAAELEGKPMAPPEHVLGCNLTLPDVSGLARRVRRLHIGLRTHTQQA